MKRKASDSGRFERKVRQRVIAEEHGIRVGTRLLGPDESGHVLSFLASDSLASVAFLCKPSRNALIKHIQRTIELHYASCPRCPETKNNNKQEPKDEPDAALRTLLARHCRSLQLLSMSDPYYAGTTTETTIAFLVRLVRNSQATLRQLEGYYSETPSALLQALAKCPKLTKLDARGSWNFLDADRPNQLKGLVVITENCKQLSAVSLSRLCTLEVVEGIFNAGWKLRSLGLEGMPSSLMEKFPTKHFSKLQTLKLEFGRPCPGLERTVSEHLMHLTELEHLTIRVQHPGRDAAKREVLPVVTLPKLKTLDIQYDFPSDVPLLRIRAPKLLRYNFLLPGPGSYATMLETAAGATNLLHLTDHTHEHEAGTGEPHLISYNADDAKAMVKFLEAKSCPRLMELEVNLVAPEAFTRLDYLKSLTELTLNMDPKQPCTLVRDCLASLSNLTEVRIQTSQNSEDENPPQLAPARRVIPAVLPRLRRLDLEYGNDDLLDGLATPQLEALWLTSPRIRLTNASHFLHSTHRTLKFLHVKNSSTAFLVPAVRFLTQQGLKFNKLTRLILESGAVTAAALKSVLLAMPEIENLEAGVDWSAELPHSDIPTVHDMILLLNNGQCQKLEAVQLGVPHDYKGPGLTDVNALVNAFRAAPKLEVFTAPCGEISLQALEQLQRDLKGLLSRDRKSLRLTLRDKELTIA